VLAGSIVTTLRRYTQTEAEQRLQQLAYHGRFDCQTLDELAPALHARSVGRKTQLYGLASLYLQLGAADQASEVLQACGRPASAMTWYAMLMLHCRVTGRPYPALSASDEKCLDVLHESYTGTDLAPSAGLSADLIKLFLKRQRFAVIGNAPAPQTANVAEQVISVDADSVVIGFNNYHLNPRIETEPDVHVVTPSVTPPAQGGGLHTDWQSRKHLIITGNAIFYRRSKVWRRFSESRYRAIHTLPRPLWSSLVDELQASPSAGLLMLACVEQYIDLTGKNGLVAGFSDSLPKRNHGYDREPVSTAHNWQAELDVRRRILQRLRTKTGSLRVVP